MRGCKTQGVRQTALLVFDAEDAVADVDGESLSRELHVVTPLVDDEVLEIFEDNVIGFVERTTSLFIGITTTSVGADAVLGTVVLGAEVALRRPQERARTQ